MKRWMAVLALCLAAIALASAQAKSFNIYTTVEEPLAKELVDQYFKETGIEVKFQRLAGGEAESRLEAEKANPQASLWLGGVGLNHMSAKKKGLTAPYVSRMASNTPRAVPRQGELLDRPVCRPPGLHHQHQGRGGAGHQAAPVLG